MPKTKPIKIINREHWLAELAKSVTEMIEDVAQKKMPNFRVSCGWPSRGGLSLKKPVIGQCWPGMVSKDGTHELFIAPTIAENMLVAGTVAHEMVHAIVGTKAGHKGPFVHVVRGIGLTGKPTATIPGPEFIKEVDPIIAKLGPYPHTKMVPSGKFTAQTTRLLKVECAMGSGLSVRMTRKWLDQEGPPICPCHQMPMTEA